MIDSTEKDILAGVSFRILNEAKEVIDRYESIPASPENEILRTFQRGIIATYFDALDLAVGERLANKFIDEYFQVDSFYDKFFKNDLRFH